MSLVNRFKFASHKYIRWFSAAFLVLFLVFAIGAIAVLASTADAVIVAAAGLTLCWMGLRFNLPILGSVTEIAMSILATGIGVAEAIAGHNYQTWTPARDQQGSPRSFRF